tara:strand:- start:729 stop:848 length:120 start_codon:yes stop_codon:yes gene_type:complete
MESGQLKLYYCHACDLIQNHAGLDFTEHPWWWRIAGWFV